MTMAVRNVFINLNQFEIVQLVGATESCYEDTKILQFHPGQAIHCRCKVSSNRRDTKSVLSTRGVAATCRLLYPTFQEISRAKSCSDCTEMCQISVLHVQSRQLVVVLLIKPLIIYWALLSTRGVAATCRLLYPTFQEISRAKSCSDCTEMCQISVLHVQSRQLVVVLLIKPLIIYWAFLLQSPDCSRCNC